VTTVSRSRNRVAFDVRKCDACGYAGRDVEPFSAGRSGLAMLTCELCPRCILAVDEAILAVVKGRERVRQ
jgi:hypothetical protein